MPPSGREQRLPLMYRRAPPNELMESVQWFAQPLQVAVRAVYVKAAISSGESSVLSGRFISCIHFAAP